MFLSFIFISLTTLTNVHGQVSECNGLFKYQFLSNQDNFTGHQASCVARGGDLATINDLDTHDFIQSFLLGINLGPVDVDEVYFGLVSEIGTNPQDVSTFSYVDGTSNDFGATAREFPWSFTEPGEFKLDIAVCVVTRLDTSNNWSDRPCTEATNQGICQLPCDQGVPTQNPSRNPTNIPTENPTLVPTTNPTINPTKKPTTNPTRNPTKNPTKNPTNNPTINPTEAPSDTPTRNPTRNPIKTLTENPTTPEPTFTPTSNPTKNPILLLLTDNPTTSPNVSAEGAGLEAGAIAGIVSTVIGMLLLVGVLFAFFAFKNRKQQPLVASNEESKEKLPFDESI